MSRAYRIRVAETLRRHIQVEDGICSTLELLPILAKERMAELLARELEREGFERQGGMAVRRDPDGVEISVSLETGEVKAKLSTEKDVALERQRAALVAEEKDREKGEKELRQQLREAMEREVDAETRELRQEVTARLEGKLRDLRAELDGVVNRVTAEALKVRAGELGTIEEISEDAATGSVTIKVRV